MSGRKWKTDFRCEYYNTPEHLANIMQELYAKGWRTDTVKLSKDTENGGWLIFSKSYEVSPSLNDVEFPAKLLWDILNDFTLFGDYEDKRREISNEISKRLKEWHEKFVLKESE